MATKTIALDFIGAKPYQYLTNLTGGEAAGGDNTTEFVEIGDKVLEIRFEQANADIVFTQNAAGLVVPNDNADNDGVEITAGILADNAYPYCFKVGTDGAFRFSLKFTIPDVSDYDVCAVGFRKAGAYVDAINTPGALATAYTDKACLNVDAGNIKILTSNDNTDNTPLDTTDNWADGESHTLSVLVDADGAVTYLIDGAAPTVTEAFSFDADELVVPFVMICKGAAASDTPPILTSWVSKQD